MHYVLECNFLRHPASPSASRHLLLTSQQLNRNSSAQLRSDNATITVQPSANLLLHHEPVTQCVQNYTDQVLTELRLSWSMLLWTLASRQGSSGRLQAIQADSA